MAIILGNKIAMVVDLKMKTTREFVSDRLSKVLQSLEKHPNTQAHRPKITNILMK